MTLFREISSIHYLLFQFAQNVFRSFDKDGDQLLDFREFMCGLSITSTASKKDQLKWAFEMYDIDGSGLISLDECITVIKVKAMTSFECPQPSSSKKFYLNKT